MTLIVVIAGIALLLLLGWMVDSHDRRHGHRPGDPSHISRASREATRDALAMGALPGVTPELTWTESSRNAKKTRKDPPH